MVLTMNKGLKIEGCIDETTIRILTENPSLQEQSALMDLIKTGHVIQNYVAPRALIRHPETKYIAIYDSGFAKVNHVIFKAPEPKPY